MRRVSSLGLFIFASVTSAQRHPGYGPELVADLSPAPSVHSDSWPTSFTAAGGDIFFSATRPDTGAEIFRLGDPDRAYDLKPGVGDFYGKSLVPMASGALVHASEQTDGNVEMSIWYVAAGGGEPVRLSPAGTRNCAAAGGGGVRGYFQCWRAGEPAVWFVTDGTLVGTLPLSPELGTRRAVFGALGSIGWAVSDEHGEQCELLRSDGTGETLTTIATLPPLWRCAYAKVVPLDANRALFALGDNSGSLRLVLVDAAGNVELLHAGDFTESENVERVHVVGDRIYWLTFRYSDDRYLIRRIDIGNPGFSASVDVPDVARLELKVVGDRVAFVGQDPDVENHGRLFVTDGTPGGTRIVEASPSRNIWSPGTWMACGSVLFWYAGDDTGRVEAFEATRQGVTALRTPAPYHSGYDLRAGCLADDGGYVLAFGDHRGIEPWRLSADLSQMRSLADINTQNASTQFQYRFPSLDERVRYFVDVATGPATGQAPYRREHTLFEADVRSGRTRQRALEPLGVSAGVRGVARDERILVSNGGLVFGSATGPDGLEPIADCRDAQFWMGPTDAYLSCERMGAALHRTGGTLATTSAALIGGLQSPIFVPSTVQRSLWIGRPGLGMFGPDGHPRILAPEIYRHSTSVADVAPGVDVQFGTLVHVKSVNGTAYLARVGLDGVVEPIALPPDAGGQAARVTEDPLLDLRNGEALFGAEVGNVGQLWATDGSSVRTRLVFETSQVDACDYLHGVVLAGDHLFVQCRFGQGRRLFVVDPVAGGVRAFPLADDWSGLLRVGTPAGSAFGLISGDGTVTLWEFRSDLTVRQRTHVDVDHVDIVHGYMEYIAPYLVFEGRSHQHGHELFRLNLDGVFRDGAEEIHKVQ